MRATQRLIARGFEAYLVGGCVRDLLLGRTPKDYDIATEARPPQVKRTFPRNCRIIGRRFKLAHLHFHDNTKILEVSTFRRTPQLDNPEEDLLITRDNEFGNAEEDALRRDFTVNALFLDPTRNCILDYTNGLVDLEARVIRTIGDPRVRFREDPVRILRAAKFAGRLGFTIEAETFAAMAETSGDLVRAAPPRLLEEILRLLRGGHALDSFQLLRDVGALRSLVPVLADFLQHARHEQRVDFWRLLDALDHRVQGGRTFPSAVLLGVLLVGPVMAKAEVNPGRSPSSVAEELLGPLSYSLRLPRRDAGGLKRICGVQHRFTQTEETKRFRVEGFVQGPYFEEALALFELRMLAQGENMDVVDRWYDLAERAGRLAPADGAYEPRDEEDEEPARPASARLPDEDDDRAPDFDAGPPEDREPEEDPRAVQNAPDLDVDAPRDDVDGPAPGWPTSPETTGSAEPDDGSGRRRRRRRRRGRRRGQRDGDATTSGPHDREALPAPDDGPAAPPAESAERAGRQRPLRPTRVEFAHPEAASSHDEGLAADDAVVGDENLGEPAGVPRDGDQFEDGSAGREQGPPLDADEPGRRRRRRRRRRRGGRPEQDHADDRFPPSEPPAPHGEATDEEAPLHAVLADDAVTADPDAPAAAADRPASPPTADEPGDESAPGGGDRGGRRRRRRGRRGRNRGGNGEGGPHPASSSSSPQQHQQQQPHRPSSDRNPPRHEPRTDRREHRRRGQGGPRDVDVVPRYRDRRGKIDVIEPAPLDLSAFDVELDPKRVPTFGSIVEGKGRPKKRSPRVPEDGVDDYRPPPPPGSDAGPSAPPPPPPTDTPDTFGDW